jgi:hypothetical protein
LEHYKLFKSSVYINTIKSLTNVKLCKDLNINDLSERFVNQRKQVLVFLCKVIKLIIVYIKAQAIIRLSNKEHKKDKEKAVKHNKTFVKVFFSKYSLTVRSFLIII